MSHNITSLDGHYRDMPFQPTQVALGNNLDACQHHLTKYIWRWNRGKHEGLRDLRAAQALLAQYIHYQETGEWVNQEQLSEMDYGVGDGRPRGAERHEGDLEQPGA